MIGVSHIPPEVWLATGAVVAAAMTAIGAYVAAHKANARMAEIEDRKQDIDSADHRHRVTQDLIANLRAEVERLEDRVAELEMALEKEQEENSALRWKLRDETITANNLRHKVLVLQQRLGGNGDG